MKHRGESDGASREVVPTSGSRPAVRRDQEVAAEGPEVPGFFGRIRGRHQQKDLARKRQEYEKFLTRRRQEYEASYRAWESADAEITELIDTATEFRGIDDASQLEGFNLKRGERAYLTISSCGLVEPRRAVGQYTGGYSGFSFRVTKGVRYHVGGSRGYYTPGPESPTMIDEGEVLISNLRVVFRGPKQSREWSFPKLLGVTHYPDGWTALQVSNRQKASGIAYGTNASETVRFRLSLALSVHGEREKQFIQELVEQHAAHLRSKPVFM